MGCGYQGRVVLVSALVVFYSHKRVPFGWSSLCLWEFVRIACSELTGSAQFQCGVYLRCRPFIAVRIVGRICACLSGGLFGCRPVIAVRKGVWREDVQSWLNVAQSSLSL